MRGNHMLVQITDEIYKLVVPFPQGGDVNCYFLKGDQGYSVIDTGIYYDQAINLWETILASGINIEKIVLTHTHPDHIGMAGWLQKRLGAPVSLSKIGFEAMKKMHQQWLEYEHRGDENQPYAFLLKHGGPVVPNNWMLKRMSALYFEPDDLFEDGEEIRLGDELYKAVWTPGHASDHFCFYNRNNRCLFTGDHVLGGVSPVITIWSDVGVNPLQDYFQSLEQIAKNDAELVLPGHRQAIPNLKQRISEIRNGHLFRMRQIVELLKENEFSAGDVRTMLYHNNDNDNDRLMMEFQMTLARLTYLESLGHVSSRVHEGLVLFSCNL